MPSDKAYRLNIMDNTNPSCITYHPSRAKWIIVSLLPLFLLLLTLSVLAEANGSNWALPDRDYRMVVAVAANGTMRVDKIAELDIDFAARLLNDGALGSFDEDSLRVVEVDGNGAALDTAVPFQFDNGAVADTANGTMVFLLSGTTLSNTTRTYHIYYDTTGSFSQPTPFIDQVDRQANQTYRGQDSFVITSRDTDGTANSTYYYHQNGGGFASILDRDNNDWISYYNEGGGYSSAGEFRGIPNFGSTFHPGYSGVTSTVIEDGPLKLTIHSQAGSGDTLTEAIWDIYPTYAQMTLLQLSIYDSYWLLYEGTPGGNLDFEGANKDYMVTSDNTQIEVDGAINTELSPEWIYFADGTINRSFYFLHNQDDTQPDSYRYQYDYVAPPAESIDNGAMTVFGYGRHTDFGLTRYLTETGKLLTLGFAEDRAFDGASGTINDVSQPLLISILEDSLTLVNNETLQLNEGGTAVISNTHLAAQNGSGPLITYTLKSLPSYGTLYQNASELAQDDTFTQDDIDAGYIAYTHGGSETFNDHFTFTIEDSVLTSTVATFTISLTAVNDPPTAIPDSATALAGYSVIIDLLNNDSDPDSANLSVTDLTQPSHGAVIDNGNGTVTYTANSNYSGPDSFSYKAYDGEESSAETAVNITVNPPEQIFLPMIIK